MFINNIEFHNIENVAVHWLALSLRIPGAAGSNRDPKKDRVDFPWFSSLLPLRDVALNWAMTSSLHISFNLLFLMILSYDAV
jgi:hypothetical protein